MGKGGEGVYWKGSLNLPARVSRYWSAQLAIEAMVMPWPRMEET